MDDVTVAIDVGADHGEGPVWDDVDQALWWVDITGQAVHRWDRATGRDRAWPLDVQPGAVALRDDGQPILAVPSGFATLDVASGTTHPLVPVDADDDRTRMNDAKCDSRGRFWAGTMACDPERFPRLGHLYVLEPDHSVRTVLDGVGISNGLGWTPDDGTLYYIDTPTLALDVFDFEPAMGRAWNRRTIATFARGEAPDGLAVDVEGRAWVTVGQAGQVRCFTADGELVTTVELPVSVPTSCTFGGPDLDELYITTSYHDLPEAKKGTEPHAGAVHVCRPGVRGLPPRRFGG